MYAHPSLADILAGTPFEALAEHRDVFAGRSDAGAEVFEDIAIERAQHGPPVEALGLLRNAIHLANLTAASPALYLYPHIARITNLLSPDDLGVHITQFMEDAWREGP